MKHFIFKCLSELNKIIMNLILSSLLQAADSKSSHMYIRKPVSTTMYHQEYKSINEEKTYDIESNSNASIGSMLGHVFSNRYIVSKYFGDHAGTLRNIRASEPREETYSRTHLESQYETVIQNAEKLCSLLWLKNTII